MFIVDAHLDLAYNVTLGRDVTKPAREQPDVGFGPASVSLPELRAGGVGLVCATIFCEPNSAERAGYRTAEEAHQQALEQLTWYRNRFVDGEMRRVSSGGDVPRSIGYQPASEIGTEHGLVARASGAVSTLILLEGADAIRTPEDVTAFRAAGVRIVGMAWKGTRYAGGTGEPGPLKPEGVKLVRELDRVGMIHDASHLSEESFWQLLDLTAGPVIASHSNCRAIVGEDPGARHLTDDMIRAIAKRGGVIGINFFDKFLLPADEYKKRRATLADVVAHVKHVCDLTGSARHVGLGTDMDGGLGREQIPVEIETSADLPRLADSLAGAGFGAADVEAILGGNWADFFKNQLFTGNGRRTA